MRALLLNEMVARTLKNMIRAQLRALMERIKYLSSEQVRECVATVFTSILRATRNEPSGGYPLSSPRNSSYGSSISYLATSSSSTGTLGASTSSMSSSTDSAAAPTTIFDQSFKDILIVKFREGLLAGERQPTFDLAAVLDVELLFLRLQDMLGVTLSEDAQRELESPNFEFIYCDIISVNPKVRFMNILDEAEGMALLMTALRNPQTKRSRLLKLAGSKFEQAARTFPNNYTALFNWAKAIYYQARLMEEASYQRTQLFSLLSDATLKLEGVLQLHEKHVDGNRWLIKVLLHRVNAEASLPLMKQLASAIGRGFALVAIEYSDFPGWMQRKLELIFAKYSRACDNDELLTNIAALFSALHNALLLLVEKYEKCSKSENVVEAAAAKGTHTRLCWIQAKNLLVWGRCLSLLASLTATLGDRTPDKALRSGSGSLSSSSGSEKSPRGQVISTKDSSGNLKPWMQGVQKLNGKLMRFQAADKFSELLSIKDTRVGDLILDELNVIIDLAENSYSLKCKMEEVASSLNTFKYKRFLDAIKRTQLRQQHFRGQPFQPPGSPMPLDSSSSLGLFTRMGPILKNLVELDLSACSVKLGAILDCLPQLSTLQALNCAGVSPPIDDATAVAIVTKLVNLTSLDLQSSSVSGESMVPLLKNMGTRLRRLNLGRTHVDLSVLLSLSSLCPKLEFLNLNHLFTEVNVLDRLERRSTALEWPAQLLPISLRELHLLDGIGVSNILVEFIGKSITGLTDLRLGAKKLTDPGLIPLGAIARNFTILHFKGLNTSESAFKEILSNLSGRIRELSLVACMGLTDAALSAISESSSGSLRSLDLNACQSVVGTSLEMLSKARGLTSLEELDLSFFDACDREAIFSFISSQVKLVTLNISNSYLLGSDAMLSTALANLGLLEDFSAESLENLGAKAIISIAKNCPYLTYLNLSDCKSIHNAVLRPLTRSKALKHLRLKHCRGVSKEIIDFLGQSLLLESVVL